MMSSVEPVASEPRIFVGQVPTDKTEEDLFQLFLPFGRIRNLHLIREGPDGKSRGCAMVLFDRWSEAEAAIEAHDGKTVLDGRTLVVKVASPRRQPSETGIAPKKLFIGQVPREVAEEHLQPFFAPFGDIEHINVLRTQRGQSAGCAFIQYRKWAHAEAAIEAHNGTTRLPGSEVPLVCKFADARRRESPVPGRPGRSKLGVRLDDHANLLANGLGSLGYGNDLTAGFSGLGGGGGASIVGDGVLLNHMGIMAQNPAYCQGSEKEFSGLDGCGVGSTDMGGRSMTSHPGASDQLLGSLNLGLGASNGMAASSALTAGISDGHLDNGQHFGALNVPLEATEQDLWQLFAPIGEVLELYVLRNGNGRSRGCAFVTFANKFLAQQAVTQLNGREVPPGKHLVVKFADRSTAGKYF
ncbi:hypothetical protein WJX84_005735 [Apatococcus fuscideae]|uniref:RRM domain-containing protein n=1 Tax=Apatococcus fuscideae TaxID=2026836 RepID=A0AAW1SQI1_9CHLO